MTRAAWESPPDSAFSGPALATIKREGDQPPFGAVFDNFYEKSHSGFEAATEYIDKLMAPERL